MKRFITLATMAVLLSVSAVAYAAERQEHNAARDEIQNGRLLSLSPGEMQEQLGKLELQNLVERQRIERISSATRNEALALQRLEVPTTTEAIDTADISSSSSGTGPQSRSRIVPDDLVTLGGAEPYVRGEVLAIHGDQYVVRDLQGNEHPVIVNQNTRIDCGAQKGSMTALMPDPIATDRPHPKGQPEDLALTAQQPGSQVGPGTRGTLAFGCGFKPGDQIEAEVSDMGRATFIKITGHEKS